VSTQDLPQVADELLDAFERGVPVDPLRARHPDLDVDGAYAIQRALVAGHEALGRRVVGRKIGLTSVAIQTQLGIDTPDFGVLLDSHVWPSGTTLSRSGQHMVAPRIEPELAFVLAEDLAGPGVTAADVLAATTSVVPVTEVIDSRVRDWKIGLVDTVADNASCFGAVLGTPVALADAGALDEVVGTLARDGEVLQEGRGSAVLGHPAEAIAWLANELGGRGDVLPAGEPILAGSFTAAVDLVPGTYVADFGPLGNVKVEVVA
jgi:2-keto-4-pentenoate hydratase